MFCAFQIAESGKDVWNKNGSPHVFLTFPLNAKLQQKRCGLFAFFPLVTDYFVGKTAREINFQLP